MVTVILRYVGKHESVSLDIEKNMKMREVRPYLEFLKDFNFKVPGKLEIFFMVGALANLNEYGDVVSVEVDFKTVDEVNKEIQQIEAERFGEDPADFLAKLGLVTSEPPPNRNTKQGSTGYTKEDNVVYADFGRKTEDNNDDGNGGAA